MNSSEEPGTDVMELPDQSNYKKSGPPECAACAERRLRKAESTLILQEKITNQISNGNAEIEIMKSLVIFQEKHEANDAEMVVLMWTALMGKKFKKFVVSKVLNHIFTHTTLLSAFSQSHEAEMALICKIQEYCSLNINFVKIFLVILSLLKHSKVLNEDTIKKWIESGEEDENQKYDPTVFCELIVQIFEKADNDFKLLTSFIAINSAKLDFRRYGEYFFDYLIAGKILAAEGSIVNYQDLAKPSKNCFGIFSAKNDLEVLRGYAKVFRKLVHRYAYLKKSLEDEFKKVLAILNGFDVEERLKLAKVTGLLISEMLIPPTVLTSTLQDHLVEEGIALEFTITVLKVWLDEDDGPTVWFSLRESDLEFRLLEFFPFVQRTQYFLSHIFKLHGLDKLLKFQIKTRKTRRGHR